MSKILLTILEAQQATGISRSKLYDLISRGKIPVVKIGDGTRGGVRLRPEDLEEFAAANLVRGGKKEPVAA
jgi:excisionase family DNA binding protein